MEISDTFKCSKLKSTLTVTVARCLRNQKEALEFWGAEAVKFNSCPCEKGEEFKQLNDWLLEKYDESLDQAENIIAVLITLKEYGAEIQMPERLIIK
jgi:hypothetical protein